MRCAIGVTVGLALFAGVWQAVAQQSQVQNQFPLASPPGVDSKALVYELDGPRHHRVDLSESGWKPHGRVLAELLTAEQPELGLDLGDAVELVRLCAVSQEQARDEGRYPFGQVPAFLHDDRPDPALMGRGD